MLEDIICLFPTGRDLMEGLKIDARIFAAATMLATVLSCKPYSKDLPPENLWESRQLHGFHDNPEAIQEWINLERRYIFDHDQFGGTLCKQDSQKCDVWASALDFLRSGRGDCDEVLALSHYSLGKSGTGLYLSDEAGKNSHAVYIYEGNNGFYGVISINRSEWEPAKYHSIEEAALSFSGLVFDYYRVITLPEDEDILLYSYEGVKAKSTLGRRFYFSKK